MQATMASALALHHQIYIKKKKGTGISPAE